MIKDISNLFTVLVCFISVGSSLIAADDGTVAVAHRQKFRNQINTGVDYYSRTLGLKLKEEHRFQAKSLAESFTKEVRDDDFKKLANWKGLTSYSQVMSLVIMGSIFHQTDHRDEISRELNRLVSKNLELFKGSKIKAVLQMLATYLLTKKGNEVSMAALLNQIDLLSPGDLQLDNLRSSFMINLNSNKSAFSFRGSIWGEFPKGLPEGPLVELEWHNHPGVPVYRYSPIFTDYSKQAFAIMNIPEGKYRLVFIKNGKRLKISNPVVIEENSVAWSEDGRTPKVSNK